MAPISRNSLESSPDKTIFISDGSVRVRLLTTETLPYLGKLPGTKEALLFDLAEKRTDLKYINGNNMANIAENDFYESNPAGGDTEMEVVDDKENILLDPNLTLEGNPLEVKYDTVEEMRKKVRAAKFTQSCSEIEIRFPIECNPFTTVQSDKWLKNLSMESHKWLDPQFGNIWIFIATDASDGRKMMITGMRKTPNTRLMVSLLGKGGAAFKKIATLLAPLSNNSSRKYVYADYEIFKPRPLMDKPEIDPESAIFRIHCEWPISGHGHVKWLSKPPIDTPMTITFSPGWFNSHVGLLERSEEIEYLLTLSQWLLKGKTHWPSQELEPYVLDDVAALIRETSVVNDTNKSDAINDDFTFKLWLILRNCTSFATLRSCLELVLKSIRYNEITALVGTENKSTIAHMLRSSEKNEYPLSRLETLTCVGLLLELGVDYMKCVMTNDFLNSGFIQNVADLNNVFVDTSLVIEDQAVGLLPIHLAFQTVNCLREYIKNTPHELVNLTRRALHKFCQSKVKPLHNELFVFDVKGTVHDWVFCDATLSDWCLHRTTFSGKESRVEHYFHFSSRVEFSHIAKRVYLPREQDQAKQPDIVAQKQTELQQTFLQNNDYSAKEHFYGAVTVLSHIRI